MEFVTHYLVDAVLVLLLLGTILWCAHRGFARSLAGIIAWIAACAIALHFCAPLSQKIYDGFLHERVLSLAEENIADSADAVQTATYTNGFLNLLPSVVVKSAQGMGIDVDALKDKTTQLPQAQKDAAAALERVVLAPIVTAAVKAIVFVMILIAVAVLLRLLFNPLGKKLHKTPVLGTTDRALGAVFGLLKGAVLTAVLCVLLRVLGGVVQGGFGRAVEGSRIIAFVAKSPFADGLFK